MTIHYQGHGVTLHHGDCLDVLRTLPDASVDSVVTDPPYGLEFMGKEWDKFRTDDPGTNRHRGERAGKHGETVGEVDESLPSRPSGVLFDKNKRQARGVSYGAGKRPTTNVCEGCGKRDQFRNPHPCPEGTAWRSEILNPHAAPPSSLAFQEWCTLWAAECLRVLKPGGHLLAFGGTRTWHRLACAVEDAGFEVRDSIAWLYGCLTADADVLTDRGWVNGLDVREGDLVAQWDHETGRVELAPVERTFRAPWDGPMRVLRSSDTDQVLTPNHRVYHQTYEREQVAGTRTGSWSRWKVAEAGDLSTWQATRLPIAGTHDGPGIGGEDYAALLGWVWTEGGFDQSGTGVRIYQSSVNPEKCDDIAALLDRMGPHKRYDYARTYTRRNGQAHPHTASTWFFSGELANRVRADLPGKRPTYDLLWRMTADEKRAMLRAAMLGDGSGWGGRSPQFYQKHEDDLVWMQTLLALIERAGKVTMRPNRPGGQLSLRQRGTTDLQARHLRNSTEHYTGEVWCVKVPSGAFLARRNGRVFITGNSGFPKSLDVSKAIDKRPGVSQHPAFAAHLAERRQSAGLSRADVSEHVVGTRTGACWNWEHHQFPEAKWWPALRDLLDLDEAKWGPIIAEAERQKIGVKAGNRLAVAPGQGEDRSAIDLDVTTHATPDAERWQGWGTALKPSFEGIVCATKPVPALARIGSRLDELEQSCIPPASGAVPSSAPTHPDSLGARAASAPASAAIRREAAPARTTPTGAAGGSSAATATSASELTGATFWNTVTSWKACWAELCEATSTSTTGTTSSTTTDLETLWSCLSQITPESTTTDPTSPDGLSSLVGAVDAMFAAAVLNSRATRTLTAIGSATSGTPPTSPAAGGSRAAFEPIVVARKPLTGTVAANVLAHGTGALNIDGCRIETTEPGGRPHISADGGGNSVGVYGDGLHGSRNLGKFGLGRWPANVVLDETQAEALDEQSGEASYNPPGRFGTQRVDSREQGSTNIGPRGEGDGIFGYGDRGGASRFFYVAKADASERPRYKREGGSDNATTYGQMKKRECNVCGNRTCPAGGEQSGKPWPTCGHDDWSWVEQQSARDEFVAHPTVKPLSLMRWLVRLVTPPGGTVLEPFAGSGTTVEACIVEGFDCIAIEREADYLPLIRQRIDRRRDPVEALRGQAADLGLFDLLGGESA